MSGSVSVFPGCGLEFSVSSHTRYFLTLGIVEAEQLKVLGFVPPSVSQWFQQADRLLLVQQKPVRLGEAFLGLEQRNPSCGAASALLPGLPSGEALGLCLGCADAVSCPSSLQTPPELTAPCRRATHTLSRVVGQMLRGLGRPYS